MIEKVSDFLRAAYYYLKTEYQTNPEESWIALISIIFIFVIVFFYAEMEEIFEKIIEKLEPRVDKIKERIEETLKKIKPKATQLMEKTKEIYKENKPRAAQVIKKIGDILKKLEPMLARLIVKIKEYRTRKRKERENAKKVDSYLNKEGVGLTQTTGHEIEKSSKIQQKHTATKKGIIDIMHLMGGLGKAIVIIAIGASVVVLGMVKFDQIFYDTLYGWGVMPRDYKGQWMVFEEERGDKRLAKPYGMKFGEEYSVKVGPEKPISDEKFGADYKYDDFQSTERFGYEFNDDPKKRLLYTNESANKLYRPLKEDESLGDYFRIMALRRNGQLVPTEVTITILSTRGQTRKAAIWAMAKGPMLQLLNFKIRSISYVGIILMSCGVFMFFGVILAEIREKWEKATGVVVGGGRAGELAERYGGEIDIREPKVPWYVWDRKTYIKTYWAEQEELIRQKTSVVNAATDLERARAGHGHLNAEVEKGVMNDRQHIASSKASIGKAGVEIKTAELDIMQKQRDIDVFLGRGDGKEEEEERKRIEKAKRDRALMGDVKAAEIEAELAAKEKIEGIFKREKEKILRDPTLTDDEKRDQIEDLEDLIASKLKRG